MNITDYQIYHLYTLGFAGAETTRQECAGSCHRLGKIEKLTDYIKNLGINALLLGPLFESTSHGYDTIDYRQVDGRLGSNEDLADLVRHFHSEGIAVILDCVFNHVGRDFFAFKELQEHRENARYKDWFSGVNFWDNNGYNDGFRYDSWAGCDNLVKLNLGNPEVRDYLKETAAFWIDTFDIDGLRMDAANVMDLGFLRELSGFLKEKRPSFFMMGECVHADYYARLVSEGGLDAVTNYEDYKGMYSSLLDKNYFEIAYSFNRLFGQGGLLMNAATVNFADNHDVDRVASTLGDDDLLEPLYLMLYTMPGIPSLYYGSEQGAKARKGQGTDAPLRPCYESMHFDTASSLYRKICRMGAVRAALDALKTGSYRQLFVASCQMGFVREAGDQRAIVLFNCEKTPVQIQNDVLQGKMIDVYHDQSYDLAGSVTIPGASGMVLVSQEQAPAIESPERTAIAETAPPAAESIREAAMSDWMALALQEARRALDEGEVPVGAVVVCGNRVVGRGRNCKESMQDPTAHAEMLAIREAAAELGRWRLDDCALYVTAEPCPMCMGAVIQAHIGKLVYGVFEKRYGSVETTADLGKHPMLPRQMAIFSGICEEECGALMESFFSRRR